MACLDQLRHQMSPPRTVGVRLEAPDGAPGAASQRSILKAAIGAFVERRGIGAVDQRCEWRLDRMAGRYQRIECDGHGGLEPPAASIRHARRENGRPGEDEARLASGERRLRPEEAL